MYLHMKNGQKKIPAMTYSPTKRICSTIGAGGLNFCVRNGNRCDPSAIITRIFFSIYLSETSYQGSLKTATMYNLSLLFHLKLFQPSLTSFSLGQALDLLVSVSSMDHSTYTPDLSTRSSFWCLTSL